MPTKYLNSKCAVQPFQRRPIRDFFMVLFTPSLWLMNVPYSVQWERRLLDLCSKHEFVMETSYTAKLGETLVWVSNHPYASFTPRGYPFCVRPSRAVIVWAHDKLMADVMR